MLLILIIKIPLYQSYNFEKVFKILLFNKAKENFTIIELRP